MTETIDLRDQGNVPHLSRTTTILRVAAATGWAHLAEKIGLTRFIPQVSDSSAGKHQTEAVRLRLALEQLGPTFVKLGQLLSVQRDLLPTEIIAELEKLQEQAASFSFAEVKQIVQADLGQPIDLLFSRFEETPMAAASMAQVHHAELHDGTNVVVKVQRPAIEEVIRADLDVMFFFARLLQRHLPGSLLYNPLGVVQELERTILRELDFLREGDNAERFLDQFKEDRAVFVPRIVWALSSKRVLTMEHSPGQRISASEPSGRDERVHAADTLMRLLLDQIFKHGFFHGDPHPGNVFILEDGRLCYHDFGIIGRLSTREQEHLRQLFLAVIARDAEWLGEIYLEMGGAVGPVDRPAFVRDLEQALEDYYATHGQGNSFGEILGQFIRLGGKHQVRLLKQILLVAKAFMLTESIVRTLNPVYDTIAAFQAYSGPLLTQQLMPDFSQQGLAQAYRSVGALKSALGELPVVLAKGLKQLQQGELTLRVRHEQLDTLQQHLDRASNRLSFSLIIAAIVIASSIVMSFHTGPHLEGIPLIGLVGYALAALLGLGWAVAMLRSGKL